MQSGHVPKEPQQLGSALNSVANTAAISDLMVCIIKNSKISIIQIHAMHFSWKQ